MSNEEVYALVRKIPEGKVCTYGIIAAYFGKPRGARLVGWIMNKAHSMQPAVPAHRVVNRAGVLSGKHHFESPTAMQEKLEAEGIIVKQDQILNFEKYLWHPPERLVI